jgi:hypothetical protein
MPDLTFDALVAAVAVREIAPAVAIEVPRQRRRGRKPLAKIDKRERCISVRVNAVELAQIESKRGSMPAADFLRAASLAAESHTSPAPVPELNRKAYKALARSAGNLNQIARALNSDPASVEIRQILDELHTFRLALKGAKLNDGESPKK